MKNKKKEDFFKSLKVLTSKELKETRNPNYKYWDIKELVKSNKNCT